MTTLTRMTVAQEAQEYIELGPAAITSDLPARILVYLARRYVETLAKAAHRNAARTVEREVAQVVRKTPQQVEDEIARKARRKAWERVLGVTFATGSGSDVTWGEATRADHIARATAQRKLSNAAAEDASLHESAVADLDRFGVTSLAEL